MIKGTEVSFTPEEQAAMLDRLKTVVESSFFIWGDQQEEFQTRMAELSERDFCLTYSHATLAAEAIFSWQLLRMMEEHANPSIEVVK